MHRPVSGVAIRTGEKSWRRASSKLWQELSTVAYPPADLRKSARDIQKWSKAAILNRSQHVSLLQTVNSHSKCSRLSPRSLRAPVCSSAITQTNEMASSDERVQGTLHPNGVAVIMLDRPKALNAADKDMADAVHALLKAYEADPKCRAVSLQSSSTRALCSGGDVKAIAVEGVATGDLPQYAAQRLAAEYNLLCSIAACSKPFLSLMEGVTMGFGLGMAGHGRYRVVTEKSLLAMPENVIGLLPDVGFARLAARAPGRLGLYLALTGARLTRPADALHCALATHYIPCAKMEDFKSALVTREGGEDAGAFVEALLGEHSEAVDAGAAALLEVQAAVARTFGGKQSVAEIVAALQNEPPAPADAAWQPQEALKQLLQGCPTTLEVTLRHYNSVAAAAPGDPLSTMEGLLRSEHAICTNLCGSQPNFAEGVRAALVDKDKQPKWSPPTVNAVEEADVAAAFRPLEAALAEYFTAGQ